MGTAVRPSSLSGSFQQNGLGLFWNVFPGEVSPRGLLQTKPLLCLAGGLKWPGPGKCWGSLWGRGELSGDWPTTRPRLSTSAQHWASLAASATNGDRGVGFAYDLTSRFPSVPTYISEWEKCWHWRLPVSSLNNFMVPEKVHKPVNADPLTLEMGSVFALFMWLDF